MRYLLYTSEKGNSVYLFKTNGMTKKWPGYKNSIECYYGHTVKIFKGRNYVKEEYRCWPVVPNCRELTDAEFVTYRLLGYIESDYEREAIPESNEEVKDSGSTSTPKTE